MLRTILMGTAAGAVGTLALEAATYLDMAIRGRPSSSVPAQTVEKMAVGAGIQLADGGGITEPREREQRLEARKSGLGSLLGYVSGLSVGALYGAIRPYLGDAPLALTGVALSCAAMVAGELPPIATRSTDPRQWRARGWLADIVPHLVYGFITASAYEAFTGGPLGRKSTNRAEYLRKAMRHSAAHLRD